MTHRIPLIALAVLAAVSAGSAAAATPPPAKSDTPHHGFASLDKNGDGLVDRTEAAASPRLAQRFDALDTGKDGQLSREELRQAREGRRGPHQDKSGKGGFARLDADKDGRISREEAKADPKFAERFDRMDADGNGLVDKADFQARARQRRDQWFADADADKDGKLSKAEFDAASARRPALGPHHRPMPPKGPKPDRATQSAS